MASFNVAVIGATGLVGSGVIKQLQKRRFPVKRLIPMASKRSLGTFIEYHGERIGVVEANEKDLCGVDLVFLCVGSQEALRYGYAGKDAGALVIDKSNAFRMDPEVPLVVPEVNPDAAFNHKGIVASPNCSTIQLVVALKPLYDAVGVKRLIVSTYQSVSGTGKDAVAELREQAKAFLEGREYRHSVYPYRIAFNLIPHIDSFEDTGYTKEEMKLVRETRKILSDPDIPIGATAVRAPVFVGHSESVTVDTNAEISVDEARRLWSEAPGVVLVDGPETLLYPMPADCEGRDEVFVGRIRRDLSSDRGLSFWVVSDNLRKGAATNAVQIAELVMLNRTNNG